MNGLERLNGLPITRQELPHHGLRSSIVAATAACALAASLALTGIGKKTEDAVAEAFACPRPSVESIQAVTAMFDGPQPKPTYTATDKWGRAKEHTTFLANKDKELGITLPKIDGNKLTRLAVALNKPDEPMPFSEYFTVFKDVIGQLNIPISMGPPRGVEAETPAPEELETIEVKRRVLLLTQMFAYAPINLTTKLGISEMAFTTHGKGFAGLAITSKGVVVIDLVNNINEDAFVGEHELYHIYDAMYCGWTRMGNDPGFDELNKKSKYTGQWPPPDGFLAGQPPTFESLKDQYYTLITRSVKAYQEGDIPERCRLEEEMNHLVADIEKLENYAYKDVVEEKASTGKELFRGDYDFMLGARGPHIRRKFIHLLARLYQTHPDVVKYYSLHNSRPAPVPYC